MSVVLPIQPDDRFRIITASAGQAVLAISFPWQDDNDIDLLKAGLNGDWVPLSRPADFSLSGAGNPSGGSATLVVPAAAGEKFLALGSAVLDRLSAVTRDGKFSSKIIDDELDRNRIIQQEHDRDIKRAFKADYGQAGLTVGPLSEGAILMRTGNRIVDGPDGQAIADAAENAATAAASATQANQSAAAALAAANAGFVFDTKVEAQSTLIPALDFVRTAGFYQPGDFGGATYKRVVAEPAHAGKFQSADGAWWELADPSKNVVMYGANPMGLTPAATSAAFQAAYDAAAEGDTIIVPPGDYDFTAGVEADVNKKSVNWLIYGNLLLVAFNWINILPGNAFQFGRQTPKNGVPDVVAWRIDFKGMGIETANSVDYDPVDIQDDVKTSPGRVQGRVVYMRVRAGAYGIRQANVGQVLIEGTPGLTPGGGYWVGIQGYSGAFAPSIHDDSLHGGNFYAETTDGATGYYNITGAEANALIRTGSSARYRSGFQSVGGGNLQGTETDAAFYGSTLAGSTVRWKVGLGFGNSNGDHALGTTSTAIDCDEQTILNFIDLHTTTVTGAIINEVNNRMETASLQLLAPNHSLLIGQRSAINTPRQYFCSSGNTTPDVTLAVSGGTVTTNQGTLALSAGEFATGCVIRPSTDNAYNLGGTSFRWKDAYFVNSPTVTSDAKLKRDIADIDPALARRMMKALRPVTFVWKDDDVPAVTETRKVLRQKVERVIEEKEVEKIDVIDGKATLSRAVEAVEREEPVFNEFPLFDPDGSPAMRKVRVKVGERPVTKKVRLKDGDAERIGERVVMEPIYELQEVQRIHRVPVMEEVEETIELAPAYQKKNVRTHWGFIAQEVEVALAELGLTTNDFAGFVYDKENDAYGLRMEQFIPVMWAALRDGV